MKNMISIPYNMEKHTKIKNKFTKAYWLIKIRSFE